MPQSLAVSATKEANLEHPGETSTGDIAAISVLTPGASMPRPLHRNQTDDRRRR